VARDAAGGMGGAETNVMSKRARRPVRINRFDNITVNAHGRTELWLAASFASSWFRDALVEAQRSKGDIDARRRGILFAVCFVESYLLEWTRDLVGPVISRSTFQSAEWASARGGNSSSKRWRSRLAGVHRPRGVSGRVGPCERKTRTHRRPSHPRIIFETWSPICPYVSWPILCEVYTRLLGRPYTTNAGKDVHVRVKKVDQPEVTMIGSWGAHERVSVKRSGAKGINR
jgi:hypothetical protein